MMETFIDYISQNASLLMQRTLEHIVIVSAALAIAIPLGVTSGILLSRNGLRRLRGPVLYLFGLGQTIPSLAILALAVGVLGIGMLPAVVALAAYALLPIARNTVVGIETVPAGVVDASRGMGMRAGEILRGVELPLAAPMIVAGIRTATVYVVSGGALAYLIGGGGLGDFIFSGIALFRPEAMLTGAIPVALLALAADYGLGYLGGWLRSTSP
jgi:osmoprotectant transport system permease protein